MKAGNALDLKFCYAKRTTCGRVSKEMRHPALTGYQ